MQRWKMLSLKASLLTQSIQPRLQQSLKSLFNRFSGLDWRLGVIALVLPFILFSVSAAYAQEGEPIKATITESRYLPPEMYGQWSVNAYLIGTNSPELFPPEAHDIWILQETDGQVTVSNPVTGATASVDVDQVKGNTATFHRQVIRSNRIFYEVPTITVDGDRLYGTTLHRFDIMRDGKVVRTLYANFRLEAQRLSGPRIRFGNAPQQQQPPQFEIDEVRRGSPPHGNARDYSW